MSDPTVQRHTNVFLFLNTTTHRTTYIYYLWNGLARVSSIMRRIRYDRHDKRYRSRLLYGEFQNDSARNVKVEDIFRFSVKVTRLIPYLKQK